MKLLKHEFSILLIIIGLFLLINLITGDRFPKVWLDEVMFSDPAINLYLGNGFTSTAWFIQTKEEMWAGNLPLYSLVLFLWVKLFGFSLLTVRSLNYFLMIGSTIMLWFAVIRLRLVNIAWIRIFLIIIFISGYGISLSYRSGRYDCLGIILGISAVLVYSVSYSNLRYFLLMSIGILIVPSGLHLCLFAVIICFLLLIFMRKSFVKEACFLGVGLIIGLMIVLAFYYLNGVLDDFIISVNTLRGLKSAGVPKDPSLPFLYIVAFLIIIYQIKKGYIQWNSPIIFGILAGLFVPIIMLLFGRFPTTYSWMVYIPLSIGVCSSMEIIKFRLKNKIFILILILLLVNCMVGLPLQIASAVHYWNDRNYEKIEELAKKYVSKSDIVYCEYAAYYSVKNIAKVTFLPSYLGLISDEGRVISDGVISDEEKKQITIAIAPSFRLNTIKEEIGGNWVEVDEGIKPSKQSFLMFKKDFGDQLVANYNLSVFKRVD